MHRFLWGRVLCRCRFIFVFCRRRWAFANRNLFLPTGCEKRGLYSVARGTVKKNRCVFAGRNSLLEIRNLFKHSFSETACVDVVKVGVWFSTENQRRKCGWYFRKQEFAFVFLWEMARFSQTGIDLSQQVVWNRGFASLPAEQWKKTGMFLQAGIRCWKSGICSNIHSQRRTVSMLWRHLCIFSKRI